MIKPVYAGSEYDWSFVTEPALANQDGNKWVTTLWDALKILQKEYGSYPVESLCKYRFKTRYKNLGETDNIRKTLLISIPGAREVISLYSLSELSEATTTRHPFKITVTGMIKDLEDQTNNSKFRSLLEVLHAPLDLTALQIYDDHSMDSAINNVAMEFYHSFMRGVTFLKSKLLPGKSNNTVLPHIDNSWRKACFQRLLVLQKELRQPSPVRYIGMEVPEESEVSEDLDSPDPDINSSTPIISSKLSRMAGYLATGLMLSQQITSVVSAEPPKLWTDSSTSMPYYNSCLSRNGNQCIPVGNENITALITQNPGKNFVAAEDIHASKMNLNSTVSESVFPMFNGTFSTERYGLYGFPVNDSISFFNFVNGSYIEANVPLKSGQIPGDSQPVLTKRAGNNNEVVVRLRKENPTDDDYFTPSITGIIEGDHNKVIVRSDTCQNGFPDDITLKQKDTGILADKVSGNNNHLELQDISITKTINNDVPGNAAGSISGVNNTITHTNIITHNVPQSDSNIIRLTSNDADSTVTGQGHLLISDTGNRNSGRVCSQNFDYTDAIVACRQMGFSEGRNYDDTVYPVPNYSFVTSNVSCLGNETSLQQCQHDLVNNCTFNRDVSLNCTTQAKHNSNTALYSGVLNTAPISDMNTAFAFWDKAGYFYNSSSPQSINPTNSVNTTEPVGWRKGHQHFCGSQQCDTSCHYVNEQFHSLIMDGEKTFLVSRQRYPVYENVSSSDTIMSDDRGLIRLTDISQSGANGTTRLYRPAFNITVDAKNSGHIVYDPPVSEVVVNKTLLSLYQPQQLRRTETEEQSVHSNNGTSTGIQLSQLSVDAKNDSTYRSIKYDLPGEEAAFISETAVFTYHSEEHAIKQHSLHYDGECYSLNTTADASYKLPANSSFIAAGKKSPYLYIVTRHNESLIFSRYDEKNYEEDKIWKQSLTPGSLFNENGRYQLKFNQDQVHLLRIDVIFKQDGTPYNIHIPQHGGCSKVIDQSHQYRASLLRPPITPTPLKPPEETINEETINETTLRFTLGSIIVVVSVGAVVLTIHCCRQNIIECKGSGSYHINEIVDRNDTEMKAIEVKNVDPEANIWELSLT